jgi:hypothetical protein
MEDKTKHMEMIQNIIQRLANNSFLLKGWTVSLVVAIFSFGDITLERSYLGIVYVPILVFWFLDSYYLQMERKYISLYNYVRKMKKVDFDLSIKNVNYKVTKEKHLKYINCLLSTSELLFYMALILAVTIVFRYELVELTSVILNTN